MLEKAIRVPARPHSYPLLLAATAVLVIDMQNDFCHPSGFCCGTLGLDPAPMRAIVPRIARLLAWARAAGVPVIYTRESHRPDLADLDPSKALRYAAAGYPVGTAGAMGRYLIRGEPGCAILDALAPLPGEIVLDKPAQSAFVATDLEATLRGRGVSHLLIAGVTSQCCVLATYRTANDLGFYGLLLEDCCAAFEPEAHRAAVDVVTSENGAVGWAATSEDLLDAVSAHRCAL